MFKFDKIWNAVHWYFSNAILFIFKNNRINLQRTKYSCFQFTVARRENCENFQLVAIRLVWWCWWQLCGTYLTEHGGVRGCQKWSEFIANMFGSCNRSVIIYKPTVAFFDTIVMNNVLMFFKLGWMGGSSMQFHVQKQVSNSQLSSATNCHNSSLEAIN